MPVGGSTADMYALGAAASHDSSAALNFFNVAAAAAASGGYSLSNASVSNIPLGSSGQELLHTEQNSEVTKRNTDMIMA